MQYELDFNQKPKTEPEQRGQIVAFPLTRTTLVQRIAGRARSIRSDTARHEFVESRMLEIFRSRQLDGLTRPEARDEIMEFRRAVWWEYWNPTPPRRPSLEPAPTLMFQQAEEIFTHEHKERA